MESKLDFLRQVGKPDCPFKLESCTKSGDLYNAMIKILYNRRVQQRIPLCTKVTIMNKDKKIADALSIEVLSQGKTVGI